MKPKSHKPVFIKDKHCGGVPLGIYGLILHLQLTKTRWTGIGFMRHDWGWRIKLPFIGEWCIDHPTKERIARHAEINARLAAAIEDEEATE